METTDKVIHDFLVVHDFSKDMRQEAYHGRIDGDSVSLYKVQDLWAVIVNNAQVEYRHQDPLRALAKVGQFQVRRDIKEALGL